MDNEKEISFGAFDSELMHQEIFIPEGFTATIEGNRIILKKTESEDEKVRNEITELVMQPTWKTEKEFYRRKELVDWVEKQGKQKLALSEEDEEIRKWIINEIKIKHHNLDEDNVDFVDKAIAWLEKQYKETSWKPSKEEMDVLYGLAYITNQYDEHKEEVITRLYQDLKREFFNSSSYENMFPNTEDGVRRRSTIQVLEYARSLDNYNQYGKADIDKNIAWLEKQGKEDSSIQQAYEWGYTEGKRIERKPWIEKQNFYEDYNSIDPQFGKPINKVEPKFKDGDWVVFYDKHESVYQIEKIENFQYTLRHILGGSMPLSFRGEDMIRPWAIQDARDGDVLACNEEILLFKSYSVQGRISLYCWYNGQTNNFHSKEVVDTLMTTRNKIYPATKEQRNLLFQKMKEAGYTFDFEKKELKKVEKKSQRMISAEAKEAMYDKPTDEDMKEALRTEYEKGRADAIAEMQKEWGEKEKQMCADIIEAIKRSGIFKEAYKRELVDWLKSIKNRVIPQSKQEWSEEDEKKQKKNY